MIKHIIVLLLLIPNFLLSQEWSSIKSYKKATGNEKLLEGNWLKKDRKRNTDVWKQANIYNLNLENGNCKYKTIREIRDFYTWYNAEIIRRGNQIKWIGIVSIVAGQLSKLDNGFIRVIIVRNKEAVKFANEGSKKVFEFAFPQMHDIYFSDIPLKGAVAVEWDRSFGINEQCVILEPLYNNLSEKALRKLDRMARGKGIFNLGVNRKLKFEGDINDCTSRYEHGLNKILPFYMNKTKKQTGLVKY